MERDARSGCPFCAKLAGDTEPALATELAVAFEDAYPISPGHMLITPRRHVPRLAGLTAEEREAIWAMVPSVCTLIESLHQPAGYNIGLNDGSAAGQTISHVHLHVIPRYPSDRPDPRGGIRWVLPDKAAYWERGSG